MKKIIYLLAFASTVILCFSCNHSNKEASKALDEMETLVRKVEKSKNSLTSEEWREAISQFSVLEKIADKAARKGKLNNRDNERFVTLTSLWSNILFEKQILGFKSESGGG